jgi:CrcB protein
MINFFYVFLGGGIGSCLRYAFSILSPYKQVTFPWSTFAVNMISCLLIGFLIGSVSRQYLSDSHKLLFITGFCGGFSTFSAFGAEIYHLMKFGSISVAIAYVLLSILLGVALVFMGYTLSSIVR